MPRSGRDRFAHGRPRPSKKALYGLGSLSATTADRAALRHGNGLDRCVVAAIVLGIRRPDLRHQFAEGIGEIAEIAKLSIFAVFGSLLTLHGLLNGRMGSGGRRRATFLLRPPNRSLGRTRRARD